MIGDPVLDAFVLVVAVALLFGAMVYFIHWAAGRLDVSRVRSHVVQLGGEVLAIRSEPARPGALVEGTGRVFVVRHRDKDGRVHEGRFRTSLWEGVHVTEDRVVE